MSEKIYAFLLRLFPGRFRRMYGDEAMLLFRDRLREERGLLLRVRLWLDLAFDLAISVPGEYQKASVELAAAPLASRPAPMFSFEVLEGRPLRPEALFFGGLLSLAALGGFAIAIGHAGDYRPFRSFVAPAHPAPHLRPSTPAKSAPSAGDGGDEEAIGSGAQAGDARPMPPQALEHAKAQVAPKPLTMAASVAEVDAAERQRVIVAVSANLKQHYFDAAVAQKMADALTAHAKGGDDNAVQTGAGFAALLTGQMRDVSHDMHLEAVYSKSVLPQHPVMTMSAEAQARYRQAMEQGNCTIEKAEMLPHGIGYLKINSFPETSVCGAKMAAAMKSLNRADAVIFDLRDNGGGQGEMVSMLAAYLFDHPQYLYSPREAATERSTTHSPVAGNRLADKQVYVLTSGSTVWAAEDFAYNLKMLHRATIVGETTRGSAHAGVFHRIDDHFGIGIPEVKVENPFGKADWEGVGVEPDIKVKATDALGTAEKLALDRLRKR